MGIRSGGAVKFAYADPSYIGCSKRYKNHPDYDGEVDHKKLLNRLYEEFPDGWALSASMKSLWDLIPMIPRSWKCRVAAWVKPYKCRVAAWVKPYVGTSYRNLIEKRPLYSWEPVIFRGGRPLNPGQAIRDWVMCNNLSAEPGRKTGNGKRLGAGLPGAKPDEFCYWIFELLNMQPGDQLVDLFPGTGRVMRAWHRYNEAGIRLFQTAEAKR
jgi:hypothetical protein